MKYGRIAGLAVAFLLLAACAGRNENGDFGGNGDPTSQDNPVPVLNSLQPGAVLVNRGDFTLTVRGDDFVEGATIIFGGTELDTTFSGDSELTCTVTQAMTRPAALDSPAAATRVLVRNPAPGGGDSQPLYLKIRNYPIFGDSQVLTGGAAAFWNSLTCDDEGRLYACYPDTDDNEWQGRSGAYMQRSDDLGKTWHDPVKVNQAGSPEYPILRPWKDGVVAAVWGAQLGYTRVFKLSQDYGDTWPTGRQIANLDIFSPPYSGVPGPAQCRISDDGAIHVVFGWCHTESWYDTLYYLNSEDEGQHWKYKQVMSDAIEDYTPGDSKIEGWGQTAGWAFDAVDGRLYLLFNQAPRDRKHHSTLFTRSLDNGKNWTAFERLYDDTGLGLKGDLAAGPHGLVAASRGSRIRTSDDFGATWGKEKPLYPDQLGSRDLSYDRAGNLMEAWVQDGRVYFRRSTDNAATWCAPVPVSKTTGCSVSQLVITPGGEIFVSWLYNDSIHFVQGIPE